MTIEMTQEDIAQFKADGFVIKRAFLSPAEVEVLHAVSRADERARTGHGRGGARQEERAAELWSIPTRNPDHPDNENLAYDAVCYSQRMVNAFERLLLEPEKYPGDQVTIHHRKLIMKDRESYCPPEQDSTGQHAGNRFQWHQDYYYWGDHTTTGGDAYGGPGRPCSDIATCAIALDQATRDNGCIQVLRGSHRFGQVPFEVEQWGERHARPDVVEELQASCEVVYCELDPGDAVIFHCEILHQSFPNPTDNPRWAFLCAYDTMHNVPNWGADKRRPAVAWDDSRIADAGARHLAKLAHS
jgi:hypothetical protein